MGFGMFLGVWGEMVGFRGVLGPRGFQYLLESSGGPARARGLDQQNTSIALSPTTPPTPHNRNFGLVNPPETRNQLPLGLFFLGGGV